MYSLYFLLLEIFITRIALVRLLSDMNPCISFYNIAQLIQGFILDKQLTIALFVDLKWIHLSSI